MTCAITLSRANLYHIRDVCSPGLCTTQLFNLQFIIMATTRIARQAYLRIRQADLASFADNIFNRTNGVPAYATIQPSITALAVPLTRYKETLAASRNRGISEVLAKNLARTELLRQLEIVADAVETLATDNPQIIVDAGFTVQQSTAQRYNGELPPPTGQTHERTR